MVRGSFRSADRVKGWKQPFKRVPNRLQSKLSSLKRKKRFFRNQVSSLNNSKSLPTENAFYHVNVRTDGENNILEGDSRTD